MIILSIFAIIAGIIGFAIMNSFYKADNDLKACKVLRIVIPVVCALVLIISFICSSISIIDSTEIGVVRTFGKINDTITSGLHFVNPISDTVTTYDLKIHIQDLSFESYTKDAQAIAIAADVQYQLDPAKIIDVATDYGTYDVLESKLVKDIEENIKAVLARYSAMPLLENRSQVSPEVYEYLKTLENRYPVTIVSAVVRDVSFSDAFEASVEAKMTAEQDALRAEEEARKAIIEAERDRDVAQVQAEAAKAKAQGEADARVIEAQGEADALEITREALENMPENWITQMYIEKWSGNLPQIMMTDDSNMLISPQIGE